MKDCVSIPSLGWNYFNSMRDENDEPIYTYNAKNMRWFVRQSIKGARVCAFNLYFKSKISDDILKIISKDLNFTGNVYDIIERYMKYKNKQLKVIEKEYENIINDYRIIDEEEIQNHINEKLSELPIHQFLKKLYLTDLMMDYDAVSLYPSAISDSESFYPRIETGYVYTPDLNNFLVNDFHNKTFNISVILKI